MFRGTSSCVDSSQFKNGITNGVDWYVVTGGMQDFNYLFTNCMEITVELSCQKKPKEENLQGEWENNKESLISFLEQARSAVKGIVTDENGNPVADAIVQVSDRSKDVTTTDRGEFSFRNEHVLCSLAETYTKEKKRFEQALLAR